MSDNPWLVESIQDFSYFKCPECVFDTKEEETFEDHATENHPLSFGFFGEKYDDSTTESIIIKGQLISKGFFWCHRFDKKKQTNFCPSLCKSPNQKTLLCI